MMNGTLGLVLTTLGGLLAGLLIGLAISRARIRATAEEITARFGTGRERASTRTNDRARLAPVIENSLGPLAAHRSQLTDALEAAADMKLQTSLLDRVPFGLLLVNRTGKITYRNRSLQKLFPLRKVGAGLSPIEAFLDHRFVDIIMEAIEENQQASGDITLDGFGPNSDSPATRNYKIEASPLGNAPEDGCWVLIQDITNEVMTEQVRRDFVANASHEIRTPLTLINGYIETLQDGPLDDRETTAHCLKVMAKNGQRLARIVEDMLAISRLEDSSQTLNLETFDFTECARDVIDSLGNLIDERNALITIDCSHEDGSEIAGDRFYWDQILINLVENALKENPKGGIKVTIGIQPAKDGHRIWVADNGTGIPRGDLPYIFKRFYRGAKHHSQNTISGTGLGLSIVKRAVEAHYGTITAESTPGHETRFTIFLPKALPPEANVTIAPNKKV